MRDDQYDRLIDKLERTDDKIGAINVTLAAQHVSLEEHIRRTQLLENQIEPIKKHVDYVTGALKLVGIIAMVAGIYKAFA